MYVPAATVYIGASLGFGDLYSLWTPDTAQDSYDDLALVRASSEDSWSFYAALPSCQGRDGGVVSAGTNDDFLTALSEDEIVVYCGHDNIGFIGQMCIRDRVEPVSSLEVGSWVFGPRDVLTQG